MGNIPDKLKLAAIQTEMTAGRPEQNISRALRLLKRAVRAGAQIILLPELFITGFDYECIAEFPVRRTEACLREIRAIARHGRTVIVAGTIAAKSRSTSSSERVYNTCHVIGPDGRTKGRYRKMHLFPLMAEDVHFSAGTALTVVNTPFGRISPCICFDIRFPELVRRITLAGAQILAVPAEFPRPRLDHWRTLLRARAIENQFFVMAANRVGADHTGDFFGHSMIVSPTGEVIAEAGEEEDVLTGRIDLREIDFARSSIPCLDRINPVVSMETQVKAKTTMRRTGR